VGHALRSLTKLIHGVDNAQVRLDGLGLLADHRLVDLELDLVVVEVLLHLLAVDVEDVQVHDRQAALPSLVVLGELEVALVEDAVHEAEVVLDLLVTLDVEAGLGLLDGGLHVRHLEGVGGAVETLW